MSNTQVIELGMITLETKEVVKDRIMSACLGCNVILRIDGKSCLATEILTKMITLKKKLIDRRRFMETHIYGEIPSHFTNVKNAIHMTKLEKTLNIIFKEM